ncbi:DUF5753 domain-containing protein [Lentzea sp. NBRC 105346]|uniref:DUF5753 domain-containing protein n=1 Tax=Lentzea sp. NBRC 105346 TaxID=3032205 RepID=UPI002555E23B|nr:DUF5753 domain-containing protein [Lentzea sp. NBRC 105346]
MSELLHWDEAKISALLNGKGGSTELEVGILLGVCRTPHEERDHLLKLFREAHLRGWLQEHGTSAPIQPRTFVEHLNIATRYVSWSPLLVPGLLQIPHYMHEVFRATATIPRDEIGTRVVARTGTQDVFRRMLQCTFYIHEQALSLPVGGKRVMRDQLHHMLRMEVRPNITIRLVPTAIGAHAGLGGAFDLMRFDKVPQVVFLENENSMLIIESQQSVQGYEQVIESLDQTSLDAEQSRRWITKLMT